MIESKTKLILLRLKSVKYQLLAFIVFSVFEGTACATTYFVDNKEGNDSSSGVSEKEAWETLKKVNSFKMAPGDIVLFKRNGFWRGQLLPLTSGIPGKPIVYGAYGRGANPIFTALESLADISGQWNRVADKPYNVKKISWKAVDIFENGLLLPKVDSIEALRPGTWYFDKTKKWGTLYLWTSDGVHPSQKNIETSRWDSNIEMNSMSHIRLENLTFDRARSENRKAAVHINASDYISVWGCTISNGHGMHFYLGGRSQHCSVEDCEIFSSYINENTAGIETGLYDHENIEITDVIIARNRIHDVRRGVAVYYATGAVIKENYITNCSESGIVMGWSSNVMVHHNIIDNVCFGKTGCALQLGGAQKVNKPDFVINGIVSYNVISNVYQVEYDGNGIDMDIGSQNIECYGNRIDNVDGLGIILIRASKINVYFNVINNSGKGYNGKYRGGLSVIESDESLIHNNTIVNASDYGVKFISFAREKPVTGVSFINNIIHGTKRYCFMIESKYAIDGNYIDYNLFYPDIGKIALVLGEEYLSLADLEETQMSNQHSLLVDPMFVDQKGLDFRLKPESRAIGIGLSTSESYGKTSALYNLLLKRATAGATRSGVLPILHELPRPTGLSVKLMNSPFSGNLVQGKGRSNIGAY